MSSKFQQAVWKGANGEDCMTEYQLKDNANCNIFDWQKKGFMSTSYEHIEL